MKKKLSLLLAAAMVGGILAGCGNDAPDPTQPPATVAPTQQQQTAAPSAGMTGAITVVSREDGSGTRGAFIELMGIEQKDADGNKVDMTVDTAEITNSTAVMLTTVGGNAGAIGYISLGSLDDSVKALEVDGVAATVDNIKNGTYAVSRPFNIATKGDVSATAQDFINYIMSDEGQAIVEENGYISQGSAGAYENKAVSGKITVAGSSSVSPVMEKLAEAYMAVNAGVTIELQTSDSTTGMTSAAEGLCDIGMASRELKDSELESGLTPAVIAMDGIAVIVNLENPATGLTPDQICQVYTGGITAWEELA